LNYNNFFLRQRGPKSIAKIDGGPWPDWPPVSPVWHFMLHIIEVGQDV